MPPSATRAPEDLLRATLRSNIPALEGVRGVAILAVLAHQLCIDGHPNVRAVSLVLLPFQVGWIGVQLFFVLSGFLITRILLDTRDAENYWSSFFARRALRIFPLYYLLLTCVFVIAPRLWDTPELRHAQHLQAWYWLYAANALSLIDDGVRPLGHCWSLSVEEQFYLLWPLAVRFLRERALARLCIAVAVAALLLRTGLRLAGARVELCYELLPARADALALGALAAVVIRRDDFLTRIAPRLGRATVAALVLLGVVGLAGKGLARTNIVTQTAGYTAVAVASALIIVRATVETAQGQGRLAAALSSSLLRRYGKYSYAIYIVHLPLHLLVTKIFITPRLGGLGQAGFLGLQAAYFLLGSLALLGLGALSYRVLERPLLEQKRLFAARGARS